MLEYNTYNNNSDIELDNVFNYIEAVLLKEFPTMNVVSEYFIISILDCKDSFSNMLIADLLMSDSISTIRDFYCEYLAKNPSNLLVGNGPTLSSKFTEYMVQSNVERLKLNKSKVKYDKVNSLHVLLSMLFLDGNIKDMFKTVGLTYDMAFDYIVTNRSTDNETKEKEEHPKRTFSDFSKTFSKFNVQKVKGSTSTVEKPVEYKFLKAFTKNLNELSSQGKVEGIVGRERDIDKIFHVLAKKNKNNVVLTGKGGVGKTALAKNIANVFTSDNVPNRFKGKTLLQLDVLALAVGASFRGVVEERMKNIFNEMKMMKNAILLIDDIHLCLGGKNNEVDISSIISNAITDDDIQFIATTSFKGYRNTIENDSQLSRLFHKIVIEPTTEDETLEILKRSRKQYENFHGIKYSDDVLSACVKLAGRYMTEKSLPDSAFDLMDESAAKTVMDMVEDDSITKMKEKLMEILVNKKNAVIGNNVEVLKAFNEEEKKLKYEIAMAEKNENRKRKEHYVDVETVYEIVSELTEIPVTSLDADGRQSLKNINNVLKKVVIGQDEAIDRICQVVKRQRVGLSNPNKPSVIFLGGKTGTGKTLVAKMLAKEIFGDEKYLVRLDMSEYSEKSTVSKLTGSSPGYIGFENGGQLTEAIKNKKHCVLLLDEVEKADQEVHNALLQLFDEGHMTDNTGFKVDFKNVIIIMTSNVGAQRISERGSGIGFVTDCDRNVKGIIEAEMKKRFTPEFINRIDDIIYFNTLGEENLKSIIRLEMKKLDERMGQMGYRLSDDFYSDTFISELYEKIKGEREYGARPILRLIQNEIENPVIDMIIDNEKSESEAVTVLLSDIYRCYGKDY